MKKTTGQVLQAHLKRETNKVNIEGINKLTLLDYPGVVACTVFTGGCDFRCPFCHNSQLVLRPLDSRIPEEEILAFLRKRRGLLEGVAITGGEPLIQKDIAAFLSKVKDMGYRIKLDTNGNHPEELRTLIKSNLVDCVAMDVKNSPERYAATVGLSNFDISPVIASRDIIKESGKDYEFRTTAVKEFHDDRSFMGIADFIRPAKKYFIQNFVDSGAVLKGGLNGFSASELKRFLIIVGDAAQTTGIRGV